ncbi:hypothetical protein RGU76_29090 [Bacillus pseudomycoides]|uniref:hypothetical protein n=2 Tax=Bacillus TaxID=1386 RepID=UPI000BEC4C60|nr:hypothetical protein [Bacillus pseudomycoides]MCX2829678.1 hypothetical protein [Bacillus sp. DHT2]MDR4918867.1 hypothetical protein [Bacillus pseudomycoides]PEB38581.1 hypothetical protein COO06_27815 [Bacillus pseudomycoides]
MKNILRYDLLVSFYTNRWKWLSCFIIFGVITLLFTQTNNKLTSDAFINYFFKGAKVPDSSIEIPYMFLLVQLYIFFIIGSNVSEDYMTYGMYVFTRLKKKNNWIISKICWLIINVTFYYVTIFCIFIMLTGFNMTGNKVDQPYIVILTIFLLMYTTSLSLGMFHITLSMLLKPIYSFIVLGIFYLIPVFTNSFYSPGAQAMLTRHKPFTNMSPAGSYIYNLVLFIISLLVFFIIIKKKDVMREEE